MGIFPSDWKTARVSPIYKSGERDECGNYRPISVLSTISKIYEKLVFEQVNNWTVGDTTRLNEQLYIMIFLFDLKQINVILLLPYFTINV